MHGASNLKKWNNWKTTKRGIFATDGYWSLLQTAAAFRVAYIHGVVHQGTAAHRKEVAKFLGLGKGQKWNGRATSKKGKTQNRLESSLSNLFEKERKKKKTKSASIHSHWREVSNDERFQRKDTVIKCQTHQKFGRRLPGEFEFYRKKQKKRLCKRTKPQIRRSPS